LSASFWWFQRKRERAKQGRKVFFFPYFARPGEEEDPRAVKTTPFWASFFFNEQWMKRRYFGQNTLFHLKGKGDKNMSEFTSVLNL